MGIVAQCPNGHRIKVKEELAGRKGVCPQCQATFRIPGKTKGPSTSVPTDQAAATERSGVPMARMLSVDPQVAAVLPRAERVPSAVVHKPRPKPDREHHRHEHQHKKSHHPKSHTKPQHAAADRAVAGAVPVASVTEPATAKAPGLHPAIAERPDLTWSVAFPGGQASAPMAAATMQQWLESGQVTGNELVWRADWTNWVSIRLVFPEHVSAAGQSRPNP